MKKGTTRVVYLIGGYAFKVPRINRWKAFLRGILANMDERLWYKHSPDHLKIKLAPSLFCIAGFVLIQKRVDPIPDRYYEDHVKPFPAQWSPLPLDMKQSNFGRYKDRCVLCDYADSRYFCSDCEIIFKQTNPCQPPNK